MRSSPSIGKMKKKALLKFLEGFSPLPFFSGGAGETSVLPVNRSPSRRLLGGHVKAAFTFLVGGLLGFSALHGSEDLRVTTLGAGITEISFALGAGEQVIAVDQSSQYPPQVADLPQVGYVGAVSAEGILSVNPSLIIASDRLGPPAVVEQLRRTRIPIHIFPNANDRESLESTIFSLGELLHRQQQAKDLWQEIAADLDEAESRAARAERRPRVTFLMGNAGTPLAAGTQTQAHGMITLAGGQNLFQGFQGYKSVSEEALLTAGPDWVLVAAHQPTEDDCPRQILRSMGLPNLARDPSQKMALIDIANFLTFGPRVGESVSELNALFFAD